MNKIFLTAAVLILFCTTFTGHNSELGREFNFTIKSDQAFSYGEILEYRVHYGFFNAGQISMKIDPFPKIIDGRKTWQITGDGKTVSGYDWFFKVRDHYESYLDQDSMVPLKYVRNVKEGGYDDIEVASFDHKNGKVYSSKGVIDASEKGFQDVLSSIYYLRNFDFTKMKKGDKINISFYLDRKVYHTQIYFGGREIIHTDLGKFRAVILKPHLVVDRTFSSEDAMTVWASDDMNLVPLRVKSDLMVGSLKADITKIINTNNPQTAKIIK